MWSFSKRTQYIVVHVVLNISQYIVSLHLYRDTYCIARLSSIIRHSLKVSRGSNVCWRLRFPGTFSRTFQTTQWSSDVRCETGSLWSRTLSQSGHRTASCSLENTLLKQSWIGFFFVLFYFISLLFRPSGFEISEYQKRQAAMTVRKVTKQKGEATRRYQVTSPFFPHWSALSSHRCLLFN